MLIYGHGINVNPQPQWHPFIVVIVRIVAKKRHSNNILTTNDTALWSPNGSDTGHDTFCPLCVVEWYTTNLKKWHVGNCPVCHVPGYLSTHNLISRIPDVPPAFKQIIKRH